jgi:hypothetical protein
MSDRQRPSPVRLRAADHEFLAAYAAATGRTIPDVLAEAIRLLREQAQTLRL